MAKALDLVGQRFGRLVVKERVENSPNGQTRFRSICDCGGEAVSFGSSLKRGSTRSCGCLYRELAAQINFTHGHTRGYTSSRTRNSWRGMKERCDNPKNSHYPIYGGRGISYPEKWKSLEGFIEDMGERPVNMTLERIDVNKNYSKENCKWETLGNQAFNITLKSNNKTGRSGVRRSSNGLKWVANIGYKGGNIYLGTFDEFEDAVKAREEAEIKYYGKTKK